MERDSETNQVTLPKPVTVTVRKLSGQAIGAISAEESPILNKDRERIHTEKIDNTNLSSDTTVNFSISFCRPEYRR